MTYTFANPHALWLLLLLIPMIVWYLLRGRNSEAPMSVSTTSPFDGVAPSFRVYLRHLRLPLRLAAVALLVIAVARPQSADSWSTTETEGIDIVMALDISSSMLAEDLKPNRLEAAKNVAASFINGRTTDNIGLVVFAGESFTQCPLTVDHSVLLNLFGTIHSGIIEDGTAVGDGLATAVNRIKESKAKSKVIILLTDGSNNRGIISPSTAGEIARTFGIRVYTIGVGTHGTAPYPFQTSMGVRYQSIEVDIDEPTLENIAATTGGKYFRATDTQSLQSIYAEIDKLEKTKLNVQEFSKRNEEYLVFAALALLMVLLEMLLRHTLLRNIP